MNSTIEKRIQEWDLLRYGEQQTLDLNRILVKAEEEYGELCQAHLKGETEHAMEEAADLAIILVKFVYRSGGCLEKEMEKKLEVLFERLRTGKKEKKY